MEDVLFGGAESFIKFKHAICASKRLCCGELGYSYSGPLRIMRHYFTLVVTPMTLLCGVFFPVDQLPLMLQSVSSVLPLTHAINLARPLLNDAIPANLWADIAVLLAYALVGFYVSLVLFRKRLAQ